MFAKSTQSVKSTKSAHSTDQSAERTFSTPMMQQYMEIKKAYPDCILLFRLGDFYELFLEDAEIGAELLDITLTARPRGKDGNIPMAGVPFHSLEGYLPKLTQAGYKVAICEQTTQPDGKTLVERDVVRIISPGNVLADTALRAAEHNYILCACNHNETIALGIADITTGTLKVTQLLSKNNQNHTTIHLSSLLNDIISRYQPKELITGPDTPPEAIQLAKKHGVSCFPFADWQATLDTAEKTVTDHFSQSPQSKKSLSQTQLTKKPAALAVTALLLEYIATMQKTQAHHLRYIEPLLPEGIMHLDRSTVSNLELLSTLHEGKKLGSLITVIDKTKTALGARLLREWLLHPLTTKPAIELRHQTVAWLIAHQATMAKMSDALRHVRDIERLTARLTLKQGSPKDLIGLAESLEAIQDLNAIFAEATVKHLPELISENLACLSDGALKEIHTKIRATMVEEPPFDPKQGGLILEGVEEEIDRLRSIIATNQEWMARFEQEEKEKTKITSLKVRFNKVFGFYIEISKSYLDLVPDHYLRRQTLVNAERFITPEMKQREDSILSAEETIQALEYQVFFDLVAQVTHQGAVLQSAAQAIATLDCLLSFARHALDASYVQPEMTTDRILELKQSRHPVVETMVTFVPNDLKLDADSCQLLLLTGPNMAGKSVLMRQVALITLLAQIGSFVPAQSAKIGITDRIFVRSGASDMISDGLSTFMVEMTETATILQHATSQSLIIMDEIGRGTSTYDGISIAWAIAEFLVSLGSARPLTLFATHYHELQELAEQYPQQIANGHMAVSRHDNTPIFLYQLQAGAAAHSFGIDVAQLAGVTKTVTDRAQTLLSKFENDSPLERPVGTQLADAPTATPPTTEPPTAEPVKTGQTPLIPELELNEENNHSKPALKKISHREIIKELQVISVENTTPLQALNVLATLKKKI